MKLDPYLDFNGRADEAIEFYKSALGAKVNMVMRFKDAPPEQCPGGFPAEVLNKVMHGEITIGTSKMMLTDGHVRPDAKFSGVSLCIQVTTDAEAEQRFTALAERGNITMPLGKTFFATAFGMVTDRFGVSWMVINQKQM
jgi:PhnB protein